MNTIEIAGSAYERRTCWCDNGTVHDATNADKVATGGRGVGTCSHCRGAGETFHLVIATAPAAPTAPEPIGEMPDWMC